MALYKIPIHKSSAIFLVIVCQFDVVRVAEMCYHWFDLFEHMGRLNYIKSGMCRPTTGEQ